MKRLPTFRTWSLALAAAVLLTALACNRQTQPPPAVKTRPAGESTPTPPRDDSPARPIATRPADTTATKPAVATKPADELPPSTFDTRPPYAVQLHVRKPEDKQPGWLKILALGDEHAVAKAAGQFPQQNIIEVTTDNIRRLQIELGYLPLAEGKRVVLRIDGQGIEITQRDRRFFTLERRPTGQWQVEKPPKD
jgi:hypothetical protein